LKRTGSVLAGWLVMVGSLGVAVPATAVADALDTVSVSVPATAQGKYDGCVGVPVSVPYTMKSRGYDDPSVTVKVTGPDGSLQDFQVQGFSEMWRDASTLQFVVEMCDYDVSGTYTVTADLSIADYEYCIYDYEYDEAYCAGIEGISNVNAAPVTFQYFAPVPVMTYLSTKVSKSRRVVSARFKTDALPAGHPQGAPAKWRIVVNGKEKRAFEMGASQVRTSRVKVPATKKSLVTFWLGFERIKQVKVRPRKL
jgi:hypothetical protein